MSVQSNMISPADGLTEATKDGAAITEGAVLHVSSAEVTCDGSADAPHAPIVLGASSTDLVICPVCGKRFMRASAWFLRTRAVWPKPV